MNNIFTYFDNLFYNLQDLYLDYKEESFLTVSYFSHSLEDEESNYAIPKILDENKFDLIVNEVEAKFKNKNRMPCILLHDKNNFQTNFKEYLLNQGYEIKNPMSYLSLKNTIKINHNSNVISINDEASEKYIDDYIHIYKHCFLQECSKNEALLTLDLLTKTFCNANSKFYNFILYKDDKPASIASVSILENHANLYNVATLPEFRRCGLSKITMIECIKKWQEFKDADTKPMLIQTAYLEKHLLEIGFDNCFNAELYVKAN